MTIRQPLLPMFITHLSWSRSESNREPHNQLGPGQAHSRVWTENLQILNATLKPGSHLPSPSTKKKKRFICLNEGTLKMIKNVFNFILKVLFVLKIYKFLTWLFGNAKKRLDEKVFVNQVVTSKFMTSQPD